MWRTHQIDLNKILFYLFFCQLHSEQIFMEITIFQFAWRHLIFNEKGQWKSWDCSNPSLFLSNTHIHTNKHTHSLSASVVCCFPELLQSLIDFVRRNGFSSSAYQPPPFNSKLQVCDNPKSIWSKVWFYNTDKYSAPVDRIDGSCGLHVELVRHKIKNTAMICIKCTLIWRR